jgi:hypothetical protein
VQESTIAAALIVAILIATFLVSYWKQILRLIVTGLLSLAIFGLLILLFLFLGF